MTPLPAFRDRADAGRRLTERLSRYAGDSDVLVLALQTDQTRVATAILGHMGRFDNTTQYTWFVEIAREFLGFAGTPMAYVRSNA